MDRLLLSYLEDDIGPGDVTSETMFTDEHCTAYIVSRQDCVVSGMGPVSKLFHSQKVDVEALVTDSQRIAAGTRMMTLSGRATAVLVTERTALNVLSRMSGIATETRRMAELVHSINPKVTLAATRKTTPGFRRFEKMAVAHGGGDPNRYGLFDAVLIKDNHIAIVGGITKALELFSDLDPGEVLEIEVSGIKEAIEALEHGANRIMLDNFDPETAAHTYDLLKARDPSVIVEISGGLRPENISGYAAHADILSVGWLTHGIRGIDISLEVE